MNENPKLYETASDLPWPPASPGRFIHRDILKAHGLSQQTLADRLGVSRKTINELVVGKRGISADMAIRLERLTGQSAMFWLNLQSQFELSKAQQDMSRIDIAPL